MNRIIVYSFVVLTVTGSLWADQLMEPSQTEQLVRHLTDTPRQFWISQGMIQARHLEYYNFENALRESTETMYYDSSRFRLDVHLKDGLSIDGLSGKNSAQQFQQDFKLNRNRIFIWDNEKYVQYYQSADYVVIVTNPQNTSAKSCGGPMTAGIIPWGCGDFIFRIIMSQNPKSYELSDNNVLLEYVNETTTPAMHVSFILNPSMDNAVLSYSIENEQALLRQTYENYTQVENQWIPSKVLIERFDKQSGSPQLVSYEDWLFEAIDVSVPSDNLFSVKLKNGTDVELKAGGGIKSFLYNASDRIDITKILEDKIALIETQGSDSVNCATAAIQHIAKQYSKNILPAQLGALVSAETKKTALFDMKKILENADLNCMAITTDLETLERIPDCMVILHLDISNHYVILDHVDEDGIWVIDLINRKFYVKKELGDFLQEWNRGIALLVSDNPITPPLDAEFRYLQADEMSQIQGGNFGTYSCTDQLQVTEQILCPDPIGGFLCGGAYYSFYERYGCIENENGGTCTGSKMLSYQFVHCINDPYTQGGCTTTTTWINRYMRACQ